MQARSSRRWVTALAAALLASACTGGGRPAATTPGARATPAATVVAATVDGNRQLAEREAARLLALTRLPPGAAATTLRPAGLVGPALGAPVADSLIDRSAYWSVPMTMVAADKWLRAHPPYDLAPAGSSTWGTPGGRGLGLGWGDRATAAWSHASLDVGLVPSGRHAVMRADSVVLWLDPRPTPDHLGAFGCELHRLAAARHVAATPPESPTQAPASARRYCLPLRLPERWSAGTTA